MDCSSKWNMNRNLTDLLCASLSACVADKFQRGRAIDRGEVDIGTQVVQVIPPGLFWRFHMAVHHPTYIKFNLSLSRDALLGVYGRRNIPPTHTQVLEWFRYSDTIIVLV